MASESERSEFNWERCKPVQTESFKFGMICEEHNKKRVKFGMICEEHYICEKHYEKLVLLLVLLLLLLVVLRG